jgi:hypothetical protein
MIRIKDYIFNENDVREIETRKKDLMVEFKDGYYEVVENATFDDIEWDYGNKISESLSCDLAKARIEELEESLDVQRSTSALLARKIIKTITLTEELYKMAKEQDSDNVNLIDRLENILKTLKGV